MAVSFPKQSPAGSEPAPARPLRRPGIQMTKVGDGIFYWGTLLFASSVLVIVLLIVFQLWQNSAQSRHQFGLGFLTGKTWDPAEEHEVYGALPYIYGTLVSSFLALLLAVPIGLGTAIFLAELAPRWIGTPVSFMVELLAAVPSVVYGLWGVLVMLPVLLPFQQWLSDHMGNIPLIGKLVSGTPHGGYSMMAGALILAIMVLPFITAVSRDVIAAVPQMQREAAFGLGATRWEAISGPVLRAARAGIMGAIILALARALGETMAVTMLIGNGHEMSSSLIAPANTLASLLANEFAEATTDLYLSALVHVALILFVITIIVNAIARLLIWRMAREVKATVRP